MQVNSVAACRNRSQHLTACHNQTRSVKNGELPQETRLADRNWTLVLMRNKQAVSFAV